MRPFFIEIIEIIEIPKENPRFWIHLIIVCENRENTRKTALFSLFSCKDEKKYVISHQNKIQTESW